MKSHRRRPWGAAGGRRQRGALVPSNSSGWSAVPSPPTVTAACLSSPGHGVSGDSCGAADRAWPWALAALGGEDDGPHPTQAVVA